MRKLKLEIDELRVETFATTREQGRSGTVLGNMPFEIPATDESHCGDVCETGSGSDPNSGVVTCAYTQRYSCPDGCTEFCTQATYCC